jgi:uncharacterized LabA/DUF88 family protein
MDILYTGRVDGFCIVSSDSDFTRLASRLREGGMVVFGLGEKKTPVSFISACDKFIYIEILKKSEDIIKPEILTKTKGKSKLKVAKTETIGKIDHKLFKLISESINDLADENGWVFLGDLGNLLAKKQPDFDPRNYGFKKLLLLIKSFDKLVLDERDTGKNNIIHVFVKIK